MDNRSDVTSKSLFRQVSVANNDVHDVIVTYFSGAGEFYVQFFQYKPFLESLAFKMQILYSVMSDTDLLLTYDEIRKAPDITRLWLAAAVEEMDAYGRPHFVYYRAQITKRMSPTIFQVRFVDYGDTLELPITSLRRLPDSYASKGPMAVRCRIAEPNIDKQTLMTKLEHAAYCCAVQIVDVDADPIVVSLFLTDGRSSENVGQSLLLEQRQATVVDDVAAQSPVVVVQQSNFNAEQLRMARTNVRGMVAYRSPRKDLPPSTTRKSFTENGI